MADELNELDTLNPEAVTVESGGQTIAITPIKVRELQAFIRAVQPIANDIATGDILMALANHADSLIEATAIGARVEHDFVMGLELDELIALASKVAEVNADFFVRRITPAMQKAGEGITEKLAGLNLTQGSAPQG